jgi:hypothetical protein
MPLPRPQGALSLPRPQRALSHPRPRWALHHPRPQVALYPPTPIQHELRGGSTLSLLLLYQPSGGNTMPPVISTKFYRGDSKPPQVSLSPSQFLKTCAMSALRSVATECSGGPEVLQGQSTTRLVLYDLKYAYDSESWLLYIVCCVALIEFLVTLFAFVDKIVTGICKKN